MGYISDVLGRKKSFIFGNTLSAISLMVPIFFPNTAGFIFSLTIKAIGGSIASGILSSILYELYLENNKITDYRKLMSNLAVLGLISSSVAALISGLVIKYSIIIPIILDASLTTLASIFGLFLIQVQKNKNSNLITIGMFLNLSF
jgi:MFS family permease